MKNPILDMVREDYDGAYYAVDTMFAIADGMHLAGAPIPAEWGYQPSPMLSPETWDDALEYMSAEYGYLGEEIWTYLSHCEQCWQSELGDEWEVVLEAGRAMNKLDNLFRLNGGEH